MSDHSYDKIIKAPGRICLFGEHQDYLGYPVIAGAINRYITIKGNKKSFLKNPEAQFIIHTPDLKNSNPKIYKKSQLSNKNILLDYKNERDYLSSSINVAKKNNLKWEEFWDINLTGNIPINAGASSSSAMVIGWLLFLYEIAGKKIDEKTLGELGYKAEVEEFDESGGMMDHFSSAIGNIIYVESTPKFKVTLIKELEKEEKNQNKLEKGFG